MTSFNYSPPYVCENMVYRHIIVNDPQLVAHNELMNEDEWRKLGITQREGWIHYGYSHCNETNPVLLFKRMLGDGEEIVTDPLSSPRDPS